MKRKGPRENLILILDLLQLFTILLCFPLETNDCSTLRTGLSDNSSRFFKLSKKDQWQAQFLVKVIAWKETSVFISLTYDTPRACVMLWIFKEPQRKAKGECFYSLRMTYFFKGSVYMVKTKVVNFLLKKWLLSPYRQWHIS